MKHSDGCTDNVWKVNSTLWTSCGVPGPRVDNFRRDDQKSRPRLRVAKYDMWGISGSLDLAVRTIFSEQHFVRQRGQRGSSKSGLLEMLAFPFASFTFFSVRLHRVVPRAHRP